MTPNTARAIASGFVARSTWSSTTDVRWKLYVEPGGSASTISRSTLGTARFPVSRRSP